MEDNNKRSTTLPIFDILFHKHFKIPLLFARPSYLFCLRSSFCTHTHTDTIYATCVMYLVQIPELIVVHMCGGGRSRQRRGLSCQCGGLHRQLAEKYVGVVFNACWCVCVVFGDPKIKRRAFRNRSTPHKRT